MLVTGVHVQVGKQPPAEPVLGQHASDGMLDDALGKLVEHLTGRRKALSTGVARVANVYFVGHFRAGQAHLPGVDDDHVIPAVNVGRKVGFVFAANQACDLAGQPTQHFTLSVNHNPFFLRRFFVGRDSFVTERIHCYGD